MWVGSFLNEASVDHNLRVAVIGATTADNLGLTTTSIGSTIYIGGLPFELIGITQPKGGTSTADDQVMIPLSTAHELFVGSNSVSAIGLSAASQDEIDDRLGRDHLDARAAPRHQQRHRRLHYRHPAPAAGHGQLGQRRADAACSPASPRSRCWSAASGS